jgi:hypothetical protein
MTGMLKPGSFRLRPNACSATVLATNDKRPSCRTLGKLSNCRRGAGFSIAKNSTQLDNAPFISTSKTRIVASQSREGRETAAWGFHPNGLENPARSMEASIETCANPVCRASALTDFSPVSLRASRARQATPANAVTRIAPGSPKQHLHFRLSSEQRDARLWSKMLGLQSLGRKRLFQQICDFWEYSRPGLCRARPKFKLYQATADEKTHPGNNWLFQECENLKVALALHFAW